jgi:hypothetical protein
MFRSQLCFSFVETAGSIHPSSIACGIHGGWDKRFKEKIETMENVQNEKRINKGGRPKKKFCRDQQLAVMCTILERKTIEIKAKAAGVSVSQFLREIALKSQVVTPKKTLPIEILQFTATLNHIAANINQVAKKRNREETFNAIERAEWMNLAGEIKRIADHIKQHLL